MINIFKTMSDNNTDGSDAVAEGDNQNSLTTTKKITYGVSIFFGIILFVLLACVIYAYFTKKPVSDVILKSYKSIDNASEKLWSEVFG